MSDLSYKDEAASAYDRAFAHVSSFRSCCAWRVLRRGNECSTPRPHPARAVVVSMAAANSATRIEKTSVRAFKRSNPMTPEPLPGPNCASARSGQINNSARNSGIGS